MAKLKKQVDDLLTIIVMKDKEQSQIRGTRLEASRRQPLVPRSGLGSGGKNRTQPQDNSKYVSKKKFERTILNLEK